eukprot:6209270-Pleurochrysis_carterae.AAC.1
MSSSSMSLSSLKSNTSPGPGGYAVMSPQPSIYTPAHIPAPIEYWATTDLTTTARPPSVA